MISLKIIDNIVENANFYIEGKRSFQVYSRIRDCNTTTRTEIMALFGVLYILSINKSCKADARRAWKTNGTGLMI
jgi:hypothetical protein